MKQSESIEDECVVCGQLISGGQLRIRDGKSYCKAHYKWKESLKKASRTNENYKDFKKKMNSLLD